MVSVIIINYNTFELTRRCIESVKKFTTIPHEIILVDNASTECDPSLFKTHFPDIKLISNTSNTGFAKGNNAGIEVATGDIVLLLNSDTYLQEDAIGTCVQFMSKHSQVGVLGCRMTYPDGRVQATARYFRSIQWELLDLFRPILYLLPYRRRALLMLGKYFHSDFNTTCDWLNGAFFMFRKELLNRLPDAKLDDRFFMYGEDQLWCWQIQKLGFQNLFFAGATIVHINNASTSIEKRLALRELMLKHEIELLKLRLGNGAIYFLTSSVYKLKENFRNSMKKIIFYLTGKILR